MQIFRYFLIMLFLQLASIQTQTSIASTSPIYLTELNGTKTNFSSLKGKWVFINYWASWCNPCLHEIKALNAFQQMHKADVAIYAVNFDGLPIQEQKELVNSLKIHYPSLRSDPATSLGLEPIIGVPATFVFNPEGALQTVLYGAQTIESLTTAISSQQSA